jgi:hypothetical protein
VAIANFDRNIEDCLEPAERFLHLSEPEQRLARLCIAVYLNGRAHNPRPLTILECDFAEFFGVMLNVA